MPKHKHPVKRTAAQDSRMAKNGWAEWKHFVLNEQRRSGRALEQLVKEVSDLRVEMGKLKVRSGFWGTIGGAVAAAIAYAVLLLGRN